MNQENHELLHKEVGFFNISLFAVLLAKKRVDGHEECPSHELCELVGTLEGELPLFR